MREVPPRAYIRKMVERSLRQLRTDYIDLYQLHRPDPNTPIEATLEAMAELVEKGTVREIGCSNLDFGQLEEVHVGRTIRLSWPTRCTTA